MPTLRIAELERSCISDYQLLHQLQPLGGCIIQRLLRRLRLGQGFLQAPAAEPWRPRGRRAPSGARASRGTARWNIGTITCSYRAGGLPASCLPRLRSWSSRSAACGQNSGPGHPWRSGRPHMPRQHPDWRKWPPPRSPSSHRWWRF